MHYYCSRRMARHTNQVHFSRVLSSDKGTKLQSERSIEHLGTSTKLLVLEFFLFTLPKASRCARPTSPSSTLQSCGELVL